MLRPICKRGARCFFSILDALGVDYRPLISEEQPDASAARRLALPAEGIIQVVHPNGLLRNERVQPTGQRGTISGAGGLGSLLRKTFGGVFCIL